MQFSHIPRPKMPPHTPPSSYVARPKVDHPSALLLRTAAGRLGAEFAGGAARGGLQPHDGARTLLPFPVPGKSNEEV